MTNQRCRANSEFGLSGSQQSLNGIVTIMRLLFRNFNDNRHRIIYSVGDLH